MLFHDTISILNCEGYTMKVQPITSYQHFPYSKQTKKSVSKNMDSTSFGHQGMWNQRKLNLLKRNHSELYEIAKYFHKSSDEELKSVAIIRNFWGIKKEEKSSLAYKILKEAVKEVSEAKQSMELMKKFLEHQKATNGKLIDIEHRSLETVEKNLKELDDKFKTREKEFYIQDNNLSESDIDYFSRHDNDY